MTEQSIGRPLLLHEPPGADFPVDADSILVETDGIRLVFTVPWDAYERADLLALFHNEERYRGPGTLEEGRPVRFETALRDDLAPRLEGLDATAAADRLVDLSEDDPGDDLLSTESWVALTVTQSMDLPDGLDGDLLSGYRTQWADGHRPEGAPKLAGAHGPTDEDTPLFDLMEDALRQIGLDYEHREGSTIAFAEVEGESGSWTMWMSTREDDEQAAVHSLLPEVVPEGHHRALMEYVARVNLTLYVGSAEFDPDTGRFSVKTSVDVEDSSPTVELFRQMIAVNAATMDHVLPGALAVAKGAEPVAAVPD